MINVASEIADFSSLGATCVTDMGWLVTPMSRISSVEKCHTFDLLAFFIRLGVPSPWAMDHYWTAAPLEPGCGSLAGSSTLLHLSEWQVLTLAREAPVTPEAGTEFQLCEWWVLVLTCEAPLPWVAGACAHTKELCVCMRTCHSQGTIPSPLPRQANKP